MRVFLTTLLPASHQNRRSAVVRAAAATKEMAVPIRRAARLQAGVLRLRQPRSARTATKEMAAPIRHAARLQAGVLRLRQPRSARTATKEMAAPIRRAARLQAGVLRLRQPRSAVAGAILLLIGAATLTAQEAPNIGNHKAVYDGNGILRPWTTWRDALDREMKYYANCPLDHGYPLFVTLTFMDSGYKPSAKRQDMIPAMQHGTGIISYLKYYAWTGRTNAQLLAFARAMGDYLIQEASTPDEGKYPRFPRSTGKAGKFPQPPDCGCQADRPYEVEPDKGGLAAYALVRLFEETKEDKYLAYALRTAKVLADNMREGNQMRSPWPFRVDYRTGEPHGEISANMSYILRLFDKAIEHGHAEFQAPRDKLWTWIKQEQIQSAKKDGWLWAQFHEDYDLQTNRNSWSPMNLARYLVEQKEKLDPDWKQDARMLIEFVLGHFTSFHQGVPVCGEQDDDKNPWGGSLSNYGGALALYCAATGSNEYKGLAWQALNYCLYAIDDDGCPGQSAITRRRGGWQEDAHTDVIHNFMDALAAFPEWAEQR